MIGNTYNNFDRFLHSLQNYFPEYQLIENREYVKADHKYTWYKTIVILYLDEYYLIDLDVTGNGGWLSYDEHKVSSIYKVSKHITTKVIDEINWEVI